MSGIHDLRDTFAAGSLFMSEAIASQNGGGVIHASRQ